MKTDSELLDAIPKNIQDEMEKMVARLSPEHRQHAFSALVSAFQTGLATIIKPGNNFTYEAQWTKRVNNMTDHMYGTLVRPQDAGYWLASVCVITEVTRASIPFK